MNPRVLVVDDDQSMCEMLATGLRRRGMSTLYRMSAEDALTVVDAGHFDAVVTDLRLPGMDGVALCQRLAGARSELPVIVITAFSSFDAAVAAHRAGAFDVLAKPVDIDELAGIVARAVHARPSSAPIDRTQVVVGISPAMQQVRELVERVARTDASVVLVGETGTGKELVAKAIHEASPRSAGPFVSVNCAALPESVADSELFGHVKGAFTDACSSHAGLFARSNGGTLFLDEVSELPLRLQAKILRALEERVVRPVGAQVEEPFDTRIVTASNRDLQAAVDDGSFRTDLLFRLRVFEIVLPPLRERSDDAVLLAGHFLRQAGRFETLSEAVTAALRAYSWPGNVRELRNCIERASVMAGDAPLAVEDLAPQLRLSTKGPSSPEATAMDPLCEIEKRHVLAVLDAVGGNRALAARILGIGRKTLYRRLEAYGLSGAS